MTISAGQQAFEERRSKCQNKDVTDALDFLMLAAANAGPAVDTPRWELKGEGAKYRNAGGQFCAIHLRENRVWACPFHGPAGRPEWLADLTAAHLTFTREDTDGPWLFIANLQQAVRFVPFILRAYDDRSA